MLLRQRDTSERASVIFAMKIRAARYGQTQRRRDLHVACRRLGIVIRMKHLEGIESGRGKSFEPVVASDEGRVCERRKASRLVNVSEDVRGRWPGARDECRSSSRQPAIECLAHAGRVPGGNKGPRNPGPPGCSCAIVERRPKDRFGIQSNAEIREPVDDPADTIDPAPPRNGKKRQEALRVLVDVVAEHVDVRAVVNRGDLNPRYERHTTCRAGMGGFGAAAHGVVIGHPEHADPGAGGTGNELGRRTAAVRGGRVCVKVDQAFFSPPGERF